MKRVECERCGASEFIEKDGFQVCRYCKTKYRLPKEDKRTHLSIENDVSRLLSLCKTDPRNKSKYINLILDIDPTNTDVFNL